MIKVGDKFNFKDNEWTVIKVGRYENTVLAKTKDNEEFIFFSSTVYKLMYEADKQRVDKLEKIINDLKVNLNSWIDDADSLEDRHSMYDFQKVLKLIEQLEEDGE